MSEKIDQFVENLRGKLNAVDDRMNNFKASIASAPAKAKADIQAGLDKAKADHEARKHKVEETKKRINASLEAKKEETEAKIAEWKYQREVKKLEKRAQRAEEYAAERVWFAMVAIDEADYATLEAIAARIEADEVAQR